MSTITLPNIRVSSDLEIRLKLKDGGVAIDWSTLTNIKASIYSDRQRSLAGRCDIAIDEEDSTILVCRYSANKPQYPGVNRVIVSCTYDGETKTYDKPAFTFVRWTDDQAGQSITIDDPDIDVEITVEDISSSILQEAVEAANSAAERANDAAAAAEHMVDIHTGPAGADGADGKSAYELAVEEGYTGTEEEWLASLHGADGTDGTDGTDGKSAYEIAVDEGFVGTEEQWLASLKGEQGNTGSSVDYPFELVNNRTTDDATKGLSAAEGKRLGDDLSQLEAIVTNLSGKFYGVFDDDSDLPEGNIVGYAFVGTAEPLALFTFDGEDWTDTGIAISGVIGPVGPEGPQGIQGLPGVPGVTSVNATVDTGTGVPSVDVSLNAGVLTLAFHNLKGVQGDTGSSVSYAYTLVNNLTTDDSTKGLTAAMGKMLNDLISALDASTNGGGVSLTPIATSEEYSQVNKDTGEIYASTSPTGAVRDFAIIGGESLKVSGRIGTNANCCLGAFFDAYGAFISSFCPVTGTGTPYLDYEITAPNNAVMVRVAGNTDSGAPYAPGVIAWAGGIKQDLERVEKEVDGELAVISPDYVYEELSQLDKDTGAVIESTAQQGAVGEFAILGGGTIKVSGRVGTNPQCCLGAFFDENGNFISSFFPSNGTGTAFLNQEVQVPDNAVMVRVAGNTNNALPYSPSVSAYTGGIIEDVKVLEKRDEFVPAFDIVSIPNATLPMYVASTSLIWTNSAGVKECYGIYKVRKGQRLRIVANASNNARYCFLTEWENAVAGQTASLLPSHPRTIRVNAGTSVTITIPADCYLGVILHSDTTSAGKYKPQHIYVEGDNFFKGLKSIWQGPSVMQGVGCQFQDNRFSDRVAQFLGMTCVNYAVTGSTVGKKPGSYESAFASLSAWQSAVSGGQVDTSKTYLVKDNVDADFPWAIYSYSGGTWSAGARTPAGAQRTPMADRITEMATDADVIIVQGGTNDFQYDWDELGENLETAITTVKGATRAICEYLVNTYPKKLIVWLTSLTPFRYQGTHTTPYSKNTLGYSGWDSHDAEMEVCEEYGIPVIDMGAEIGLSPANPWWDDYDSAGTRVHPNDEGHRLASAYLVEKLLTMKKSL